MKICIIDDEWICRFLVQRLIQKAAADSEVILFDNGMEAFEFIQHHHSDRLMLPELILLDVNMPVANGFKFLDMLQDLHIMDYHPLIYIVSSSQDADDVGKAQTYASVRGYLVKPITPAILAPILEAALFNTLTIK